MDEATSSTLHIQLPVSKIKKICKLDPDLGLISAQAVQLITMATESFIKLLAKAAYERAALGKRRTIQARDIDVCIKSDGLFNFLDGTLDGWPDRPAPKKAVISSNTEMLSDTENEDGVPDDIVEEEIPDTIPIPTDAEVSEPVILDSEDFFPDVSLAPDD